MEVSGQLQGLAALSPYKIGMIAIEDDLFPFPFIRFGRT
jgi:hypothetical protein